MCICLFVYVAQLFVKDNQSESDVTQIDYVTFIGSGTNTTNMSDFKRVRLKNSRTFALVRTHAREITVLA